ncbi:xanthine dehydrogenase family protein molybdopterin-binding subunit [Pseudoduganella umbonata]|uniref:Xanthine dehydrogenase YagR molybdenum-binding subunit n=1 Tax=Pseudoduganella umbonata TaxID=864828 RepID=A0A4P8HPR2_9BURK|nr:xanthine dehydrogenase family protein molybdopterin-binding subunit [Pseudoduganella umbonata]MBB3221122.1 xanthine dehydrogenase YagR molybdenum-binding subunit [Pseudoduganella umbonata]QCP10315.1 xanthine dehydrogenase family protein molybdopterin-binding subunit [Pseudoduganella umbonata]
MSILQKAVQTAMQKAVEVAPDAFIPGGIPDTLIAEGHALVGAPVSRVDGAVKVRGAAPFAAEFALDGMAYAALVHSTIAKGRVATLDTAAAEAAPGVVLVMTHENAPRMKPVPMFLSKPKAAGGDNLPVLQDGSVHWNGQPVALVLAGTQEQADHAATLVRVTYHEETATTSVAAAKARGLEDTAFQGEPQKVEIGDAEAALAAAPHRVDAVYRTPRLNHNAIELHAATVAWHGDELRIHDATQAVAHTAWSLAQVFGLRESQVRVTSPFVGGGFGGKALWQHQVLAAAAAKLAGRPVRIMLSREGVYRGVGGRTLTEQRVAIGAGDDGRFTALIHTGMAAMTAHNNMPEPFIMPARSLYAAGSFKLAVQAAKMDMLANTFMRAPGESVGSFALECAIDELAERMNVDPTDLRGRNEPEKDPTKGSAFSSRNLVEAYRMGAESFGWAAREARPRMRREGEWWVGMGCATATYPYYRMPGGAARITLTRESRVHVEVAAHEMGMGTATVQAQIVAARLGVPLENVTVSYGDSAFPGTVLAGGSQQTASIGRAVIAALRALFTDLLRLGGAGTPLDGLHFDEVRGHRRDNASGLCKAGDPLRHASYAELLSRAGRDELKIEGQAPPPLETLHWSMHSTGAIFCEARVNAVTGEPRVTRLLGAFDCGRILNAKTAASQFRGGMIMGLGMALMEETLFDERNGRVMNPTLWDYHVPAHLDVPAIDVMWTDIPDPHAPAGARGIGEIGITGTAAAVANAIYNACGIRVRDLPVTLDKLLD